MSNLGELFRQIRLSKNWSIREAAKRMGISFSYLSILEKGIDPRTGKDSSPKPDTLRIISKAYDYPYEELMKAAGYLNDDGPPPDMKFDLTVFISNINLIMDKMSIEELSSDILSKTGYSISPNQIRSYLNGDIEPFPGTINILSNYIGVPPSFWYVFNTEETLEQEMKKYKENLLKSSVPQFSKDYFIFANINEDIRDWILHEDSIPYIKIALDAHRKRISSNTLKLMIETIANEKNRP